MRIRANSGQALAELIIACAILAIVLFGVVTTINYSVTTATISSNKTQSVYYAQEGLELARAARNNDWATFASSGFLTTNNGLEDNLAIPDTIFTRTIQVVNDASVAGNNDRRVTSTVSWFDGTTRYETVLETLLTNK